MRNFACLLLGSAAVVGFESTFGVVTKRDKIDSIMAAWVASQRKSHWRALILE